MALPLAHAVTGWMMYRLAVPQSERRKVSGLLYVISANAPDLDFVPGLLLGVPALFHRGILHSVGCAVLFGLSLALFCVWTKKEKFFRVFLIFSGLYLSHLLLDFLTVDTRSRGTLFLWPFSATYYRGALAIFSEIPWDGSSPRSFFRSVLQPEALWTACEQALFLLLATVPVFVFIEGGKAAARAERLRRGRDEREGISCQP